MKVYIVVSITAEGKVSTSFSIEPLAVCSSLEKALDMVSELEDNTTNTKEAFIETAYDIFEFKVDEKPILLSWLKKEKEIFEESIQDAIINLMKKGYIDQLIGEDGNFYYTLTDIGKSEMKSIPEQVRKFFKKKG